MVVDSETPVVEDSVTPVVVEPVLPEVEPVVDKVVDGGIDVEAAVPVVDTAGVLVVLDEGKLVVDSVTPVEPVVDDPEVLVGVVPLVLTDVVVTGKTKTEIMLNFGKDRNSYRQKRKKTLMQT